MSSWLMAKGGPGGPRGGRGVQGFGLDLGRRLAPGKGWAPLAMCHEPGTMNRAACIEHQASSIKLHIKLSFAGP